MNITEEMRARQKLQTPLCLWFTGYSGAGKSTLALLLEERLFAGRYHTFVLDSDDVRRGLNSDLGFSASDRTENIRRAAETARLFLDSGLIVIASFISPFRIDRCFARLRCQPYDFVEVFVDTPFEECERRDPKGLYAKARRGELLNFTGFDSRYEPPGSPELRLDTVALSAAECVDQILAHLQSRHLLRKQDLFNNSV